MMAPLGRYLQYVWRGLGAFSLAILLPIIGAALASSSIIVLTAHLTNAVVALYRHPAMLGLALEWVVLIFIAHTVSKLLGAAETTIRARVSQRISLMIRETGFDFLAGRDLAACETGASAKDLAYVMGVLNASDNLVYMLASALQAIMELLVSIAILMRQAGLLVALMSCLLLLPQLSLGFIGLRVRNNLNKANIESIRVRGYLASILTGVPYQKELRIYRANTFARRIWRSAAEPAATTSIRLTDVDTLRASASSVSILLAVLIVSIILLTRLANGNLSVGVYVAVVAAIGVLGTRVLGISTALTSCIQVATQLSDASRIMQPGWSASTQDDPLADSAAAPIMISGNDLTFVYPGAAEPAVLMPACTIPPGSKVGIWGPNGVGKTTLAKLLCGLYPPTTGSVSWGDRSGGAPSVSFLFQDFARYPLSIRDNVALGAAGQCSDDVIRHVLAHVGLVPP